MSRNGLLLPRKLTSKLIVIHNESDKKWLRKILTTILKANLLYKHNKKHFYVLLATYTVTIGIYLGLAKLAHWVFYTLLLKGLLWGHIIQPIVNYIF
jgi:hypothetical protein